MSHLTFCLHTTHFRIALLSENHLDSASDGFPEDLDLS